ncbi:MAG: insulinase family protein [Armatimonadetes bacterium]|nr:insulinase family protein [Armatimonadota bacterium]
MNILLHYCGTRFLVPALLLILAGPFALAKDAPNPIPANSVVSRTLPNGATVLARSDPYAKMAIVDLWVRAGSVDGTPGAAHAVEHMLFKASSAKGNDGSDAVVESAGGVIHASTLPDATHFWSLCPPDKVATVASALVNLVQSTDFTDAGWEIERKVMREELERAKPELADQARAALLKNLLDEADSMPVAGTNAGLSALTPDSIRAFHKAHYGPDRMAMIVVGPVPVDSAVEACAKAMNALEQNAAAPESRADSLKARCVEATATDGKKTFTGLAFTLPDADQATLEVLCSVLRGRLNRDLSLVADSIRVQRLARRRPAVVILVQSPARSASAVRASVIETLRKDEPLAASGAVAITGRLKWSWWLDRESPTKQANALGTAFTLGAWKDACAWPDSLTSVTAARLNAVLRMVADIAPESSE